jgi:DNA-binding MarR family transcriptional regulator
MGLRRQSVQQTADALVADGLALFVENPRHRRAKLLEPTADGRSSLAGVERAHAEWADALAAQLQPSQIEAATAALRALTDALEPEGSR